MTIIDGKLPDDLQGHLFFLAVAGFVDSQSIPGTPIVLPSSDGTPVINGDGMICRLDFHKKGEESKPGEVWLKTKIAGTPSYWADKATADPTLPYGDYKFHNYGVARISTWLGVRNVVNTAWLPMKFSGEDYRLLVTLDAGRPYEIDTASLEVVTPVGWNKEWNQQIKLGLPFGLLMDTAHPYFDPRTNEMFTVNFTQSFQSMLPPQFQGDAEDLEEFLPIIAKFLQALERLLEDVIKLISRIQIAEEKLPLLQKTEEILHQSLSEYVQVEGIIWDVQLPKEYKEFWRDLQQILKEEIYAENLDTLKEHLEDFLQLLKVGSQFLGGVKDMEDVVYLIRWDGKGDFERWKVVLPDGTPVKIKQTMHQIGVTQDYVVLMDASLKIGLNQLINIKNEKIDKLIRQLLDYQQSPETSIYIIPRVNLKAGQHPASSPVDVEVIAQKVVFPLEVFHFLLDYDNPEHKITLHAAHASAWDVAEWLRKEDTPLTDNPHPPIGMVIGGMDINRLGRYVIDAQKGKLDESVVLTNFDSTWTIALFAFSNNKGTDRYLWPPAQLENIYWNSWGVWNDLLSEFIFNLYQDYKYREESTEKVRQITAQGNPSNLFRVDTKQMKVCDSYEFPSGYFGNSPQFVPRANGTGESTDGYLVCTVLYDSSDRQNNTEVWTSEIWIFDAKDLKRGGKDPEWGTEKPLCRLSHPHFKFGFTTHTTWLPKIAPRQPGLYCIPVSQDYADRVPPDLQEFFKNQVYSHFPECEANPVSGSSSHSSQEF